MFSLGTLSLLTIFVLLNYCPTARAQDAVLKQEVKQIEKSKMGWNPTAKIGVNASFSSSNNVVGKPDGSNETYGVDIKGSYDFSDERSEWRNSLSYAGGFSKTLIQPRYIKSTDLLKAESLYLYTFADFSKVGSYVKVSGSAPLFFGEDVRASETTYNIKRSNNSMSTYTGSTLKLTDGFKPLTTRESTGAFWKAFNDGNVKIEVRLGIGAEQTMADGQLSVSGVDSNGSITVKELRSLSQLGVEAGLTGKGQINETTGWEIGVETLTPFVSNKETSDDRDPFRLTNIDGLAKLSSNITSWASVSYDYKATIKPQLIDRTQQSHMLVLSVNYNLF